MPAPPFTLRDADARLWPQTERLKAALLAATVLPSGSIASLPLALSVWITCGALALRSTT